VSGELNLLRVCAYGECERYFYAGHFRETHCRRVCYRRHDKAMAVGRARQWREEQRASVDAALMGYARATLQKLSLWMVRGLRKQRVLTYNEGEGLDDLRTQFEAGILPFDQLWKQRGSRALFAKLQKAGVV